MRRISVGFRRSLSVISLSFLTLGGCGGGDAKLPPLAPVSGIVRLDGQPLKNALVTFAPPNTRMSAGRTDEQGRYDLSFNKDLMGAAVGTHVVRISRRDADPEVANVEQIPARYNENSQLTAVVQEGDNEISWDLQSR